MLWRYEVRVAGAWEAVAEYESKLSVVAGELGAITSQVRVGEGDLLAIVDFQVSDEAAGAAEGDELKAKIKQVLPPELHDRISLTISPRPDSSE